MATYDEKSIKYLVETAANNSLEHGGIEVDSNIQDLCVCLFSWVNKMHSFEYSITPDLDGGISYNAFDNAGNRFVFDILNDGTVFSMILNKDDSITIKPSSTNFNPGDRNVHLDSLRYYLSQMVS